MSHRAVCFVIMPFGRKPDASGRAIDFDHIYSSVIAPAIADAGLLGVRGDEEARGGYIHKLMFERLILSEFAIADVSIANANVYYELGIRHAARPSTTIVIGSSSIGLPFDIGPLRMLPYEIDHQGQVADVAKSRKLLGDRLKACRQLRATDSPLYELLDGYAPPPVDHQRTDLFRQQAAYSAELKSRLAAARWEGVATLDAIRDHLGDLGAIEAGVAVDLLLSYRAISAWERMLDVAKHMDATLARTTLVREQAAFALNRLGRGEEAERFLKELIAERGPSSETFGLLGRVYKDRWERASQSGDAIRAKGCLKQAIAAYRAGFEADWRDAYPGVNALTLMAIADPDDAAIAELEPVVRYAVTRRLVRTSADYWDHATLLELAALRGDWARAEEILPDLLAAIREQSWEPQTTARNLRFLAASRRAKGQDTASLDAIAHALDPQPDG